MTEQRLGILGGMGRPTRLTPCRDPDDLICSGQMNCPCAKVLLRKTLGTPDFRRGGFVWCEPPMYVFHFFKKNCG